MLDRFFGEQLLDLLPGAQELERGLDDAVEEEGEVDEEREAGDLQPLEGLPAEAERDHPDEEGAAAVDGGARGGADAAGDGEPEEVETSDRDHDEEAGDADGLVLGHLPEPLDHVEHAVAAGVGSSHDEVQHQHADQSDGKTEQTFPAHDLDRLDVGTLQEELLEDELGSSKDLSTSNQDNTQRGAERLDRSSILGGLLQGVGGLGLSIGPDDAGEPDHSDADHDTDQRRPLEQVQLAAQEHDAEQAHEQDQGAARHLVDGRGHHEQAGVDEGGAEDVADGGQRQQHDAVALEQAVGAGLALLRPRGLDERVFGVDARRVVVVVVVVVRVRVTVADGLVPVGLGALPAGDLLVGGHQPDDEPAADLADEHLRRLQHGLLEGPAVLGVGVVAVPHALVVLERGG